MGVRQTKRSRGKREQAFRGGADRGISTPLRSVHGPRINFFGRSDAIARAKTDSAGDPASESAPERVCANASARLARHVAQGQPRHFDSLCSVHGPL
jgi:hypothetical protein